MATLNIKNVPEALHRKLKARARKKRRSVAQEVLHLLSAAIEAGETHSILELKGLGEELWKGIDAAKHIEDERRSWS